MTPTTMESEFLTLLNAARADPAAYGLSVGLDLAYIAPQSPLVMDPRLLEAARLHSQDMFTPPNFYSHTGRDGSLPADRAERQGYGSRNVGESIGGGYPTAASMLRALIQDDGNPDFGHRHHLLGHFPWAAGHRDVGIGIVGEIGSVTGYFSGYYTIDTGLTSVPAPPPEEDMATEDLTPTPAEVEFLRLLNEARANPTAWGQAVLGPDLRPAPIDFSYIAPKPPLVFDPRLMKSSRRHSKDMADKQFFAHEGSDGSTHESRIADTGYGGDGAGSIASGFSTPKWCLQALLIDAGVPSLGHRHHLLGHMQRTAHHIHVGIGIIPFPEIPRVPGGPYYTIDTGYTTVPAPTPNPDPPPGGVTATFVDRDKTTKGNWPAKYATRLVPQSGAAFHTWAAATDDPRALVKTTGVAECWYRNDGAFEVSLPVPGPGLLGLYFADWDTTSRGQKVELLDAATRAVLDTKTVENFYAGEWLNWKVTGPVIARLTKTSGANAVFLGAAFKPD